MLQKESLFCNSLRTGGWVKREERVCFFGIVLHARLYLCVFVVLSSSLFAGFCASLSVAKQFSLQRNNGAA